MLAAGLAAGFAALLAALAWLVSARLARFASRLFVAARCGAGLALALLGGSSAAVVGRLMLARPAGAVGVGFLAGAFLASTGTVAALGALGIRFVIAFALGGRFLVVLLGTSRIV